MDAPNRIICSVALILILLIAQVGSSEIFAADLSSVGPRPNCLIFWTLDA
jgi:hypothetical protein